MNDYNNHCKWCYAPMKLLQKDNHVCGSPIIGKTHGIWRIKFNATGTNNSPIISMRYLIFILSICLIYSQNYEFFLIWANWLIFRGVWEGEGTNRVLSWKLTESRGSQILYFWLLLMIFNFLDLPVFTLSDAGKYTLSRTFCWGYSDVALSPIRNFAHKNTHNFWNGVTPDDEILNRLQLLQWLMLWFVVWFFFLRWFSSRCDAEHRISVPP